MVRRHRHCDREPKAKRDAIQRQDELSLSQGIFWDYFVGAAHLFAMTARIPRNYIWL
jgi:hypothetical protein